MSIGQTPNGTAPPNGALLCGNLPQKFHEKRGEGEEREKRGEKKEEKKGKKRKGEEGRNWYNIEKNTEVSSDLLTKKDPVPHCPYHL